MDYIGSKQKLLDWIFEHLTRHTQRLNIGRQALFLDGCTGTGSVAVRAAQEGFRVVAADLLDFPQHMVRGKLCLSAEQLSTAHQLIDEANALLGAEGFFYQTYSPAGAEDTCHFFTEANAKRIDAARAFILGVPVPEVQSYLFYCLLEAMSRVSNTAGTHGAFMKQWKDRALAPLILEKEPALSYSGVQALQGDVQDLVGQGEDILYLDPPYTKRQYAPNYHLYNTVVRSGDPVATGKTGLPQGYLRSDFCKADVPVGDIIENILRRTTARLVLISYSSDGTLGLDGMLTRMMKGFGHVAVEVQVREHTRYRSAATDTERSLSTEYLREYLFIIEREDDGVLSLGLGS